MPALPSQRHLFDIPEEIAYFNCAYNSPQLNESRARLTVGSQSKSHPWKRTTASFFEDADRIRLLAARALGGDADGYAVVPAASYGLSTAARAIEPHLRKSDVVLVCEEEFPSNVLPWKRATQESGAVLETVPLPPNGDWTASFLQRIRKGVKVAVLSHCHWTNGAHIDLKPIGKACREVGSALVVDATQSLGAMPFPFEEIEPDFMVAAGYKWLLGPYGFGLLHVSERWRDSRPLEESWLARVNAEDFAGLVKYSEVYMPGARRFDVGEKCTATILPGAIAALEQIEAWGVDQIAATLSTVTLKIATHLTRLGFQLPPTAQRSPHMLGAQLPTGHTSKDVVAELKAKNIFISQRGGALRFAPHLHVSESDVNRLFQALDQLLPVRN